MKFNSLGQYFYKLYAIIFLFMLVPIGVFIVLYQGLRLGFLKSIELNQNAEFLVFVVPGIVCLDWALSFLFFFHKLKSVRNLKSLGEKLSRYATLTLVRNAIISTGMLLLAGGYFLTENKWLTIIFMASLILPVLSWPSPKRVCSDLALKGDEQMMVLYRMDSF